MLRKTPLPLIYFTFMAFIAFSILISRNLSQTQRLQRTQAQQPSPTPTNPSVFKKGLGVMLFIQGSNTSQEAINAGNSFLNPKFYRIDYLWSITQTSPTSQYNFNTAQDQGINRVVTSGRKVNLSLRVGQGWMTGCPNGQQGNGPCRAKSKPPLPQYINDYSNFVKAVVQKYRNSIAFINIENEQNSESTQFDGMAADYLQVLATAYQSIKQVSPEIIVTDGGVVGDVWGACIAKDWQKQGKSQQEIINMAQTFYYRKERHGQICPIIANNPGEPCVIDDINDVNDIINQVGMQGNACDKLESYLAGYQGKSDAINFHNYEDYQSLKYAVDYILAKKSQYNLNQSILTNEIGLWNDPTRYINPSGQPDFNSPEFSKDVFKKIVYAKSLGVEPILWFSVDIKILNIYRAISLIDDSSTPPTPRLAANSFKFLADRLSGEFSIERRTDGPTKYDYVFHKSGNPDEANEYIWAEDTNPLGQINSPLGLADATLYNYQGVQIEQKLGVTSVNLSSPDPVIIKWVKASTATTTPTPTTPQPTVTSNPTPSPTPAACIFWKGL